MVNKSYQARIQSIDLLRGMAIILMALDHAREFFGTTQFDVTDLSQTSAALFLTRWITHFCAPIFILLTGVSAYLYSGKTTRLHLAGFLFKRGLWLILLELTVITFSWKFTLDNTVVLQVIWALGWSMIVLAGAVWLPRRWLLVFSLLVIVGHNFFDNVVFSADTLGGKLWHLLHIFSDVPFGNTIASIYYPLIPWIAVATLGYCMGPWFALTSVSRSKRFFWLGVGCLLFFIVLRFLNIYGDSYTWEMQARGPIYSLLSFIAVTKYPPSLLYLALTFGLAFMCWPLLEKWRGMSSSIVLTYGKVALFFYLIHLLLLHIGAILYSHIVLDYPGGWWSHTPWVLQPTPWPEHYQFSLGLVYGAWLVLLLVSYPLCRAYKNYKSKHTYNWLRYL
ncbi:MAG TPA: heparan-alpha-glucosaminide N-acetyltransferase domain-containing protein [Gammaproteobacteria bacterium]|jgi:uncharacterized membrane protein|nr:heparan-alpha-glucosaminide N-acetyltransferase domain-containing protein [Gammaproteobacteria bacterium]